MVLIGQEVLFKRLEGTLKSNEKACSYELREGGAVIWEMSWDSRYRPKEADREWQKELFNSKVLTKQ